MTPERLAKFIPQLLQKLQPPAVDIRPEDPASVCRWLYRLGLDEQASAPNSPPGSPLGPLWPQLPQIAANNYSLAGAPQQRQLFIFDAGPIQTISAPGINSQQQPLPALESCHRVSGHVIACNGEVAFGRTDAVLPGPLEFRWQRFYRHSNTADTGLGIGWRHSLSEQLLVRDGEAELHTAEGRLIHFTVPAIGHSCYNRFERLLLHRQSLHSYRVSGFDQPHKIFRSDGVNSALPLAEIRDRFGNALTVDYQEGLPRKIVSSWGRVVEFRCRDRHIEELVNAHAPGDQQQLCRYQYDAQQLVETVVDLESENYRYREQLLAAIDSAERGSMQFQYDGQQRCCQLQFNLLTQTLSWRGAQQRCTLHSSDRHPIHWKFNDCGQLIGEQQQDRHRGWLYDLYGNLCQAIGTDGQRSIYRYDELGRLARYTRNGISDRYLYDERGFPAATQLRGGQVWRYEYSDLGLPDRFTDPESQQWHCQYSERGQLLQITDPEGGRVQFNWDSQGQLQSVRRGDRQWGFEYDYWQRLTALIVDGETRQQWHYGQYGELREITIGEYQYRLDYDEHGRPCALHGDNDQSLHWHFDETGNCRQLRFADGREWHLHCNALGQVTGLETEAGKTVWQYDRFGQLVSREDSDSRLRQWHYNPDGKVREYRDNDARWYFHYSDDGTPKQIRNNSGQQCEFHYDLQQRLVQADNGQSSVRFQYDRRNLLVAEHCDSRDADSISLKHQYDARGWLKGSSSDSLDLAYTLAPDGEVYGVDANGEAILRCEGRGESTIRIQGDRRSHYRYQYGRGAAIETDPDLIWQFQMESPLHLAAPQTDAAVPGTELSRDMRGNIIREFRSANRREYLYQYDGWGLLSSAECGDFKTYFRYDPFGRRLSKLSTHRKSTRRRRINTSWYGLGLWGETIILNGKSQPTAHYLHHPSDQSLLCRWRQGEIQHYLVDPRGQPLAMFDHDGELLWEARDKTETTERGVDRGPWRGRGLLADSETGLWYCWRGYWHPLLQCWLTAGEDFV